MSRHFRHSSDQSFLAQFLWYIYVLSLSSLAHGGMHLKTRSCSSDSDMHCYYIYCCLNVSVWEKRLLTFVFFKFSSGIICLYFLNHIIHRIGVEAKAFDTIVNEVIVLRATVGLTFFIWWQNTKTSLHVTFGSKEDLNAAFWYSARHCHKYPDLIMWIFVTLPPFCGHASLALFGLQLPMKR